MKSCTDYSPFFSPIFCPINDKPYNILYLNLPLTLKTQVT